MGLLRSLEDDRVKKLRSLSYSEMGGKTPYVQHEIGHSVNEFNARTDDLIRISKMMVDLPGQKFIINQGILNTSDNPGNLIKKLLRGAKETVAVIGSTLAQVPVSGTGTHITYGFGGGEYLKGGIPAANTKLGKFLQNTLAINLGGVNGAARALQGEEIIQEPVAGDEFFNPNTPSQFVDGNSDPTVRKFSKFDRHEEEENLLRSELKRGIFSKIKNVFDLGKALPFVESLSTDTFTPEEHAYLRNSPEGISTGVDGRARAKEGEKITRDLTVKSPEYFEYRPIISNLTRGSDEQVIRKTDLNISGSTDILTFSGELGKHTIPDSKNLYLKQEKRKAVQKGEGAGWDNRGNTEWEPLHKSEFLKENGKVEPGRVIAYTLKNKNSEDVGSKKKLVSLRYDEYDSKDYIESVKKLKSEEGNYWGTLENPYPNESIIPFYFTIITGNGTWGSISFPAFLDAFDDSYNGDWGETKYIGRAESFYTYQGFKRDVNFSFKVAAFNREALLPLYNDLNTLAGTTAPTYDSTAAFMRGTFCKITVGDYLTDQAGFVTSVKFNWQTLYPWETGVDTEGNSDGLRVPHVLEVSISFTPIHDFNVTTFSRYIA